MKEMKEYKSAITAAAWTTAITDISADYYDIKGMTDDPILSLGIYFGDNASQIEKLFLSELHKYIGEDQPYRVAALPIGLVLRTQCPVMRDGKWCLEE